MSEQNIHDWKLKAKTVVKLEKKFKMFVSLLFLNNGCETINFAVALIARLKVLVCRCLLVILHSLSLSLSLSPF